MFDLTAATAATERDFGAIISQLDSLPEQDWKAPVRCAGWQVTDLAVHVVGASRGQAEGLAGPPPGSWRSPGSTHLPGVNRALC